MKKNVDGNQKGGYVSRMTATQYAEAIIKTAINNGMTLEDIAKTDPQELAKAHLHCQLKAIKSAGEKISK